MIRHFFHSAWKRRVTRFRLRYLVLGFWATAMVALGSCHSLVSSSQATPASSLYFIGNSLTDEVLYKGFDDMVESQGRPLEWGRHMIPGAPLEWIFEHPNDGFREEPYGTYPQAFANYTWDYVTLQPTNRLLNDDLTTIAQFLDLLKERSPEAQVFIYAQWPGNDGQDWDTQWLHEYTDRWDGTQRTRDYYETLTQTLNEQHPNFSPFRLIPVGHVMYALNQKMKAGEIPGFTKITDVYIDRGHLNSVGSYIVATTFYATIFQSSPIGLPVPPPYQEDQPISDELAAVIQNTVWDVVTTTPLSGVTP
ncbi:MULTISPECIES: DUF4886 domain-containing protein [unclassified Leptolyngbya]|uniref:DUF4886 domain-containing protein n=1 Tax=unclassified Leptolyngbya TaxID=2650499 RepID=UPI001689936B|nr:MULTISPECIES: DUF4886 domain-containing protein [unclassified Leptolyngbya]MBD1912971.1 PEP-CTERM sorting domain-containing protein [Leptolyngbya sp. FACHB-8]MBD2155718.1 PEP-CTERM sorting domain-containing protein [Leptolyngbya sp. FACHB-16]